ncbi:MAG: GNAT family N-acetyltransferase [Planctomycetales bacterium]|nr:GNAT family N-acetyltransferase [Planctomycetales bacterium]
MFHTVEINRIEELESYRLTWHHLLAQTRYASFFQTFEWLRIYWRHFGEGQRLRTLIVYRGGEPIGIVPLVVRTESTRAGNVRTLTYPLHGWGSFYGPIGREPGSTMHSVVRHLQTSRRDWDLLDLRWQRLDADLNHTPRALRAADWSPLCGEWSRVAMVDLPGDWDEYLATRGTKIRGEIRRNLRRVEEQPGVTFERIRPASAAEGDGDPHLAEYDECVELARRTWQAASVDGTTLSHPSVAGFLRETHVAAARAGALDMALVRHHGRLVAFGYNYHHDGRVCGIRMGYDPDYRPMGMGNYLYAASLRDSIERGDTEFDLGPGGLEHKQTWLTRLVPSLRFTHYAAISPRAQLLWLKHRLLDGRRPTFPTRPSQLAV